MTLDNFPTTRPSFTANFARSQQLPPQVTFTRASTGTYVGENGLIQTTANNTPRFTWENGRCQGLLIEESRTNYITDNSTLTGWGANSGTAAVVASTTVCPDGSTDGIQITGTLASDGARKYFTAIAGAYIGSCYARSRTGSSQDVKVAFSGLVGPTQTLPASGEWVRIQSNSGVSIGAGSRYLLVAAVSAGTLDIDVWGEQVEIGSFPTSYIPTSGATVTRAADICDLSLTGWWNPSVQTWTGDFQTNSTVVNKAIVTILSGNERPLEFVANTGSDITKTRIGTKRTSASAYSELTPANQTGFNKAAGTITASKVQAYVNGNKSSSPNPITLPTGTFTTAHIGWYGDTSTDQYHLNGTISRISYYPVQVSDDTLEVLTQ